jgi:site-specific DNA-methyltransferase (adenine-specific)
MNRLIKDDCLEAMRRLPDNSADACITDPPYGKTECKWDAAIPFAPMWRELRRVVKPAGAIVLFASQPFTSLLIASNLREYKYSWVWEKSNATGFLNAKKQPLRTTEDICVFYRAQPTYNPQWGEGRPYKFVRRISETENYRSKSRPTAAVSDGRRYPRTALRFASPNLAGKVHPTQKPLELLRYLVRTYTYPGDTVLDFTMGSGTAGVACAEEGRDFVGVERDGNYFALASARIAAARLATSPKEAA